MKYRYRNEPYMASTGDKVWDHWYIQRKAWWWPAWRYWKTEDTEVQVKLEIDNALGKWTPYPSERSDPYER